ncbi:MAG TPA: hypothetical protein EYP60_02615 [bacterium (Candidatus Stahlbacteria)]|nr:hypothetical protein [Candidatus Stahlbacteria bacterium]
MRYKDILTIGAVVYIVFLCGSVCMGQGNAAYAGEFLHMGVGARPIGMGGAFTSVADDPSAGYWNPAGLTQLSGTH